MKIEKDKSYKILIEVNNTVLTYKCKIIDINDNFITFIDDRGKEWNYNVNYIISYKLLDYEIEVNWKRGEEY